MRLRSPIMLLHGWAANHHIYDDFINYLPSTEIFAPDLPGHGADHRRDFDAIAFADELSASIQVPTHIVAWSLGGQVALQLASRHPEKVASLCLCATFAKLLQSDDYPEGLIQSKLLNMIPMFESNYAHTMQQFLQLQILYTPERKEAVAAMLPAVTAYSAPVSLVSAQHYAQNADIRQLLPNINIPTLCIYGDKDTITPSRLGDYLRQHLPHAKMLLIKKAIHAPFISHPQLMAAALTEFWTRYEA